MNHIKLLLGTFLSSAVMGNAVLAAEKNAKPNFILIMADDLGYGDISCYGNKTIHTPNIDKLASQGIKFTNYHANGPVCSPTRAALMTGKYQQRTGIEGVITAAGHRDVGLNLDEVTLAEELKKYGYVCAISGKWHLGYQKKYNPVNQGFDEFNGYVSGNVDYIAHIDQEGYADWWRDTLLSKQTGYSTDLITDHGIDFIKRNRDRPFFLYLSHEAPHSPFQNRQSKPLRVENSKVTQNVPESEIPSLYKDMVEILDEGIGRIMQTLRETGIDKNTVVFFCSDNGGTKNGSNGIYRGTKGSIYEGGIRVPAVFWYPEMVDRAGTCNHPVVSMDVLPTFLDVIGEKPSGKHVDGVSFKPLLLNEKLNTERDLFWKFGKQKAVISGKWKLVHSMINEEPVVELFDIQTDPSEKNNLADENKPTVDLLLQRIKSWQTETGKGVVNLTGNSDAAGWEFKSLPSQVKTDFFSSNRNAHVFVDPDYYIWGMSVIRWTDGKYHGFYSRWPKALGFNAWLTDCEIAHAVADRPEGPFTFVNVVLKSRNNDGWDVVTAHNPAVCLADGKICLYYVSNDLRGKFETETGSHYPGAKWLETNRKLVRNTQRVGLAQATDPSGTFVRSEKPIVVPDDKLFKNIAVNPAVTYVNGKYVMIIKGDEPGKEEWFRIQLVGHSDRPEGPFVFQEKPVYNEMQTEDAGIWYDHQKQRFYMTCHVMGQRDLALFSSGDGYSWTIHEQVFSKKEIRLDDGSAWSPERVERPFVLTDDRGNPVCLYLAVKDKEISGNIAVPVMGGEK